MRHALIPHSEFPPDAGFRVNVEVVRPSASALTLRYIVTGDIGALQLPPTAEPARTDELWRSTCFEAFVAPADGYFEFNFSPSTQWAAYQFEGYRHGVAALGGIAAPHIEVQTSDTRLELCVALELDRLVQDEATWRLGLSAVIEEMNGRKSYWALKHPPGKPDFHHSDCFALEVPTA